MGCLARDPHPLLVELLHAPQLSGAKVTLPYLLAVDAAHVVMLTRQRLLPRRVGAELLRVNRELLGELRRGEAVIDPPASHRGLYMLYEQAFIDRLGPSGGAAHLARSRNDIGATLARMRLRDELLVLGQELVALLGSGLCLASAHVHTAMAGFTHLQPAQPSTLGHYLAGVLDELLRGAEWLDVSYEHVDACPMGAGAGLGTSLDIDRELVAGLLGFSRIAENATDAVVSRDYAIQVLAAAAAVGTTLSRLAQDLQTWSSAAYGFLGWPDDLVSTSSIMPQKRNVFVWESVRGRASAPAGALVALLMTLKGLPFANSVDGGGESTAPMWPALEALRTAVRLSCTLLERVEVARHRMLTFLADSKATMTALADHLVAAEGLAFRQAHEAVGRWVARGGDVAPPTASADSLSTAIEEVTGEPRTLAPQLLRTILDPQRAIDAARYGGGPAHSTTRRQLRGLERRVAGLDGRLRQRVGSQKKATRLLAEAIEAVSAPGVEAAS
jgi:argininosuccinate lyase